MHLLRSPFSLALLGRNSGVLTGMPSHGDTGKAKGKGGGKAGSQPYRDADANRKYWLEGELLPQWWPKDRRGYPIHKLFRAMSKDFNELWPVPKRPNNYPDRPLSDNEEKFRCFDAFDAVNLGSQETSAFLHCSVTEAGAKWFLHAGRTRRNTPHMMFCKVNLVTLYKKGTFHQNSFINLSTEEAWNKFFWKGPHGYFDDVRSNWEYAKANAVNHDEFLICWRGEVPLEIFEVVHPPLYKFNESPRRPQ